MADELDPKTTTDIKLQQDIGRSEVLPQQLDLLNRIQAIQSKRKGTIEKQKELLSDSGSDNIGALLGSILISSIPAIAALAAGGGKAAAFSAGGAALQAITEERKKERDRNLQLLALEDDVDKSIEEDLQNQLSKLESTVLTGNTAGQKLFRAKAIKQEEGKQVIKSDIQKDVRDILKDEAKTLKKEATEKALGIVSTVSSIDQAIKQLELFKKQGGGSSTLKSYAEFIVAKINPNTTKQAVFAELGRVSLVALRQLTGAASRQSEQDIVKNFTGFKEGMTTDTALRTLRRFRQGLVREISNIYELLRSRAKENILLEKTIPKTPDEFLKGVQNFSLETAVALGSQDPVRDNRNFDLLLDIIRDTTIDNQEKLEQLKMFKNEFNSLPPKFKLLLITEANKVGLQLRGGQ